MIVSIESTQPVYATTRTRITGYATDEHTGEIIEVLTAHGSLPATPETLDTLRTAVLLDRVGLQVTA